MGQQQRKVAAFSLIELLVVISIVTVLLSVLLPSLSEAREAAKGARCMANQRQFLPAIMAYGNDSRTYLPIGARAASLQTMTALHSGVIAHYTNTVYHTEWNYNALAYPQNALYTIALASDLRNRRFNHVLKCPTESYRNAWGTFTAVSYGWNSGNWGMGTSDFFTAESRRRIRMQEIRVPSQVVMTGDWMDRDGLYEYVYHDQFTWNATLLRPNMSSYHGGGAKVLWADGHVTHETMSTLKAEHFDRR